MRQRKKTGLLGAVIRIGISLFLLVLMIVLVYFAATTVFHYAKGAVNQSSNHSGGGKDVEITIPQGASTKEIAKILHKSELIGSEFVFRMKSRFGDFDNTYKQGKYVMNTSMDMDELMEMMQTGAVLDENDKITIPEGYTTKQIASYLEEKGIVTAKEFINEANNGEFQYSFLKDIPVRNNRLEGYLFPDTYFISEGITAHEIIDKMLSRFDEVYNEEYQKAVEQSSYSLDEIICIASIIEAEIRVAEERERASGVIYNRLKEKMPLQMCSTVLYALDKRKDVLLYDDLKVNSPYNTYENAGLPIGPIANPGEAAIKAALYPEDNEYLYFVLKSEEEGTHEFTSNYDEFLKAKEKYKQKF